MIWLTYRQFRFPGGVALLGLVTVAVALAVTGPHLADLYDSSGIAACRASDGDCGPQIQQFVAHYSLLQWLSAAMLILPAVLGVFWGAPLVAREFEAGTYRLVWTQSTTRTRWLAVKVASAGLATVAVAGLFSLALTWWSHPLDVANGNRFSPLVFSERGIVPAGYAAFAFALGLAAGTVLRRTLPAMGVTLLIFVAAWLSVLLWVRPHFATPIEVSAVLKPPPPIESSPPSKPLLLGESQSHPGDWVTSEEMIDPSGHIVTSIRCTAGGGDCLAGYTHKISYQPASRFWRFQWMETGLYAAFAAGLIGFAFWWMAHRVT